MRSVILYDNQAITRLGMEFLVSKKEKTAQLEIVADKGSLVKLLIEDSSAMVILDYSLSDFTSADEVLNVAARFPEVHWLLFSEELNDDLLRRTLLNSNQISVVLKSCDEDEIEMAITHAYRNERFICSRVTNQLLMPGKAMQKSEVNLTPTEVEILKEIALGKTTKEIAAKRNLSFHTIITHRKNIFRKLDVNNVHEATRYAMRAGIIDIAEYYI